jgi:hypothetical protein
MEHGVCVATGEEREAEGRAPQAARLADAHPGQRLTRAHVP